MSSLKVDNITGRGNAGFTGSVKSEGGNTTTNLQQGLCKSFINFNGEGTVATRDSFNISTLNDTADGTYQLTFQTNMNDGNYTTSGTGGDTNAAAVIVCQPHDSEAPSTSGYRVTCLQAHASINDEPYIGVVIHGDLA